ncbi:MAG: N-acetylmuramoyl-L-alanine amidase, partial [Pseudomonadota bacterium]
IQRETKNQSAQFALALIPALKKANWPALTNTHRNAGFFVLLAPDVPAVLLEMGFMTNVHDEALLTSERHRRRLVKAIVASIDHFFNDRDLYLAQR